MADSVMCTKCDKWVHGRCQNMKRVTSTRAKDFVCELCVDKMERIVEPREKISFFDQVVFVKSFSYLINRLNASGGSEAAANENWMDKISTMWRVAIWEKVFLREKVIRKRDMVPEEE